jgi:AcrR family transcriptional regulator
MIPVKNRSITDIDKHNKKEFIKKAAVELFIRQGEIPSASSLAKESGIGKGTIYLYFSSKEEIYLDILEQEFLNWFARVLTQLNAKARWSFEGFSHVVLEPLCGHKFFQNLAKFCPGVIEANVTRDRLIQYREQLAAGLNDIAERFSQSFVSDTAIDPRETLVQSYGIISGVWTESQGNARFKELNIDSDYPALFLNFERDAGPMLVAFWRGKGWREKSADDHGSRDK